MKKNIEQAVDLIVKEFSPEQLKKLEARSPVGNTVSFRDALLSRNKKKILRFKGDDLKSEIITSSSGYKDGCSCNFALNLFDNLFHETKFLTWFETFRSYWRDLAPLAAIIISIIALST